jgi:hypothetical protein
MKWPALFKERLGEVVQAIAPLAVAACLFQFLVVQAPAELFIRFLVGVLFAIIGMQLMFIGIDMGILPMGRFLGAELPRKQSITLILGVAFAMGFATTIAEPDVLVLSDQVQHASGGAIPAWKLSYLIAASVGVFTALALLRLIRGFSMNILLAIGYGVAILLSIVQPDFVPLAYDAGSVTTGIVSAPAILALALGLSAALHRHSVSDGFGLLGLASLGPIIAVLIYGLLRG